MNEFRYFADMWLLGYDINIIWSILIFFTVFMVLYSGVISLLEPVLPTAILELFRYGKTLNGPVQSSLVALISVPKSYFTHFYIFSSIYVPALLCLAFWESSGRSLPDQVTPALDFICTSNRTANTSRTATLIALIFLSLQCFRRLYECVAVNQASKSTMNITHYIVGFAHYFCTGTGILCEAPGFAPGRGTAPVGVPMWKTDQFAIFCILSCVFFMAWTEQLNAHRTFAQLKIANPTKHSIPTGGLFALVSCPHYTMEILIYTILLLVLGVNHSTMLLVWAWVLINQCIAGLMSHSWYKATFKEYPPERKAIIPYLL